jgi:hypothetical protein
MKTTVSVYDFRDAFLQSDTYKDNFSYEGLTALFDYLEEYEEGAGEEIDFDMIALCCEFTEYDSAIEAVQNYDDFELKPTSTEEEEDSENKRALEWLHKNTQVIEFDGGIIIQDF